MIDVSQRQKQPPEVLFKKRCSWKYLEMVSLELEVFSQNLQKNTCARDSLLVKLQAKPATLLKESLWHRCFPVN